MNRPNIASKFHAPTLTHDFPGLAATKHRDTVGLEKTLQGQGGRSDPAGAQHIARNDMTLDFAGALPDPLDSGVPPDSLQREI